MNGKFVRDYVYFLTEKAVLCKENDGQYSMSVNFHWVFWHLFLHVLLTTNRAPILGIKSRDTI